MTEPSVAVFIDVENIHNSCRNHLSEATNWPWIANECQKYGRVISIQAYADWIKHQDIVTDIRRCGIETVLAPLSNDGKSSADSYIIVAAMKLFSQNSKLDTMILVSGDRDYIPLIIELRAMGIKVVILSVAQALSKDLQNRVDHIIEYRPNQATGLQKSSKNHLESAQTLILDVLQEMTSNKEWANLAALGLKVKKADPDFSHQQYGYKKLVDMLEDMPAVEIDKVQDGNKTVVKTRLNSTCKDNNKLILTYNSLGSNKSSSLVNLISGSNCSTKSLSGHTPYIYKFADITKRESLQKWTSNNNKWCEICHNTPTLRSDDPEEYLTIRYQGDKYLVIFKTGHTQIIKDLEPNKQKDQNVLYANDKDQFMQEILNHMH